MSSPERKSSPKKKPSPERRPSPEKKPSPDKRSSPERKQHLIRRRSSLTSNMETVVGNLVTQIKTRQTDKRNIQLLSLDETTYQAIYYILSKTVRSKNEMLIIKVYLSMLPRFLSVIQATNLDQLLFHLSCVLKCEKKPMNSIIFKYGERGNKFFILLRGTVSVIIPKENTVYATYLTYFKYLMSLVYYEEEEMLHKNLFANKDTFTIEEKELSYCLEQVIKHIQEGKPDHFSLSHFDGNETKIIVTYIDHLIQNDTKKGNTISADDYINRIFPFNDKDSLIHSNNDFGKSEKLTIFSYFEVCKKYQGDIFGEIALQNSTNKRTGTLICVEDSIFGTLSRDTYNQSMRDVQTKIRRNNVNFILSFQIFKSMNWNIFESRYFNYFKLTKILQGKKIISQGQKYNKIFFIKEGLFELTAHLSFRDINAILKAKRSQRLPRDVCDEKNPKTGTKTLYRVAILNNKDVIGLTDVCCGGEYFLDAKCVTPFSWVYSIDYSIFDDLCRKLPEVAENMKSYLKQREDIIINRLCNICFYNDKQQEKYQVEDEHSELVKVFKETRRPKGYDRNIHSSHGSKVNRIFLKNEDREICNLSDGETEEEKDKGIRTLEDVFEKIERTSPLAKYSGFVQGCTLYSYRTRNSKSFGNRSLSSLNQRRISMSARNKKSFLAHSLTKTLTGSKTITDKAHPEIPSLFRKNKKKKVLCTKIDNTPEALLKTIVGPKYKKRTDLKKMGEIISPARDEKENERRTLIKGYKTSERQKSFASSSQKNVPVVDFLAYETIMKSEKPRTRNRQKIHLDSISSKYSGTATIGTITINTQTFRTVTTGIQIDSNEIKNQIKKKLFLKKKSKNVPLHFINKSKPLRISVKTKKQ